MRSSRFWGRAGLTAALLMLSAGCDDVLPDVDLKDYLDAGAEDDASEAEPTADELAVPDSIKQPAAGVHTASKYIESEGEVVTRSGGLSIPRGALADGAEITVAEVDPSSIRASVPRVLEPVAPATAFTPHGLKFEQEVTLSLFYEAERSAKLVALRLDDEDDTTWEVVEATFENNVAFVKSKHFSIYTVTGCDPDNDPDGFCSDLSSGAAKIEDLPAEDFVTYVPPPSFGGDKEPPKEDPVMDAGTPDETDASVPAADAGEPERDAGKPDERPDGSTGGVVPHLDASVPHVDGSVPQFDASVPRSDAGASTQPDAGTRGDAGTGEQACSWYEVCEPVVMCVPPGGTTDGGAATGPLKDGQCPVGYQRIVRDQCHLEPHCTPEWCAVHPADCKPEGDAGAPDRDAGGATPDASYPDYDASVPPQFDAGPRADAGVGGDYDASLPPGCHMIEECKDEYECRGAQDAGVRGDAADGGNCSERLVCHEQPCDVPPNCQQVCGEVSSCDPTGANCVSKPYCHEECTPSEACPAPVCHMEQVCGPVLTCDDTQVVLVKHCDQHMVCDGAADAGAPAK